ncbi:hypothetical protein KSB_27880 [Ktedonobacter robiniae]|uniref:Uncharacterized protein n=1 Tax=Ktedonobacter robiniae TaxID=2778365 RepID=A0ABQ3UNM7_9CHLR|nr:hypothetical protein KSB_27880 [Ktedonobacter robiniae]
MFELDADQYSNQLRRLNNEAAPCGILQLTARKRDVLLTFVYRDEYSEILLAGQCEGFWRNRAVDFCGALTLETGRMIKY